MAVTGVIFKQATTSVTYAIISRVTLLFINLIAAHYLPTDGYGFFAYLTITVASVAAISSLGIGMTCNTVAAQEYSKAPSRVSATFTFSVLLSVLVAIVASVAFSAYGVDYKIGSAVFFITLVSCSILAIIFGALEGLLYGLAQQRFMLPRAIISLLISSSLTYFLILKIGIFGALSGLVMHRVVAVALFLGIIKRKGVFFDIQALREERRHAWAAFVHVSLPLSIAGAMAAPTTAVALSIVGNIYGPASLAPFGYLYQFFLVITFIPGALSNFFIAKIANRPEESVSLFVGSALISAVYGFASALGFFSMQYFPSVHPDSIELNSSMLIHFSLAIICYSVSTGFNGYWAATNRAKYVATSQLAWGLGMLAATFLGVSRLGSGALSFGLMVGAFLQLLCHVLLFSAIRGGSGAPHGPAIGKDGPR